MREWHENIGFGQEIQWQKQGLHVALIELLGLDPKEGWALLDDWIAQARSIQSVYDQIQELIGERLLVDKTPTYSMDMDTLMRAETLFEAPKYIYLFRHPYAVIDSFLRVRLDRGFGPSLFEDDDVDPYVIAETVWAMCNRSLLQFFKCIEPERCHWIRYEELVSDPARVMAGLCQFLRIPFDEALLNPYDGRRERIVGSLGDPNIFQHSHIDPGLGEAWKKVKLPRRLDESTKQLAVELGYELPEEVVEPPTITNHARDQVGETQLLASLNRLSEEEVFAVLNELLAESKE
jgi:hypothetical protein